MRELECWWNIPDYGFAVALPPRCGSSSVLHSFVEREIKCYGPVIGHADGTSSRDDYERRIMVVRDPVERFMSLWRSKCRNQEKLWVDDDSAVLAFMSPKDLIKHIERTKVEDAHWATLSAIEAGYSTEIIHYTELNALLDMKYADRLNNTWEPFKIDPEVEERVKEFYKDDYGLL